VKYNICEIFYSIQGEGKLQGFPFVFIRFSGCNLKCPWCDTKYALKKGYKIEIDEIIKKAGKYRCKNVCITGGEPYLQPLKPILEKLKENNFFVSIETNGTIWQDIKFDWITVSPKKQGKKYHKNGYDEKFIKVASEFKYVITGKDDFKFIDKEIRKNIVLQPVNNDKKISKLIIKYIKENPYLNYQIKLQLHKILKLP